MSDAPDPRPPGLSRRARVAWLGALLALLAAGRVAAVFTTAVNWDEFALLDRARRTLHTGELVAGGRPGLAVLALLPFVADCEDEIAAVRSARLLWLGFTAAFLAGLGALCARLQPDPVRRRGDAWLGVALLALVPAFLDWSLQVRSDQPALAAGVWGCVALLASRHRTGRAAAAGALFAAGFLASQKVAYLGALAAALAGAEVLLARELRPRREALRALAAAAAFGAVLGLYRGALALFFDVPEGHAARALVTPTTLLLQVAPFEFYRKTLGFSQYREMLPTLVPHAVLLAGLALASWRALRAGARAGERLLLAWGALALGAAVCAFHAGAFFYFWMTLGVFPSVAFAVARVPVRDLVPARRRALAVAAFWAALALPGIFQMGFLLADTQAVQRDSLAFVHRNFGEDDAGFHPERGPFCWPGQQPLRPFFSMTIYRALDGPDPERNASNLGNLLHTFRAEPVLFLLQSFRLNQFPQPLRQFWAANYQPYRDSVFVLGRRLGGRAGTASEFELIAPGAYRWLPAGGGRVRIDDRELRPGEVAELASGRHAARFVDDVTDAMLVLAVNDAPGPAPLRFYKAY